MKNIWSFHSSSRLVHCSVCSCTVWHQCESCIPFLNTTSTSAFSVLPSYSALTFLCPFASLLFTYLGPRRGANVLVVTSSWSCTSSCPWCQLMGLSVSLLLMERPHSLQIQYSSQGTGEFQDSLSRCLQVQEVQIITLSLCLLSDVFSSSIRQARNVLLFAHSLDKAEIPCSTP